MLILDLRYVQIDDLIQIQIMKEEPKGYFRQLWDSFRGKNVESEMRKQFHQTLPVLFKHYVEFGMEQTLKNRILYFRALLRGFFSSRSRANDWEIPWDKLKGNEGSCKEVLEDFISLINHCRIFSKNFYYSSISTIGWNI